MAVETGAAAYPVHELIEMLEEAGLADAESIGLEDPGTLLVGGVR